MGTFTFLEDEFPHGIWRPDPFQPSLVLALGSYRASVQTGSRWWKDTTVMEQTILTMIGLHLGNHILDHLMIHHEWVLVSQNKRKIISKKKKTHFLVIKHQLKDENLYKKGDKWCSLRWNSSLWTGSSCVSPSAKNTRTQLSGNGIKVTRMLKSPTFRPHTPVEFIQMRFGLVTGWWGRCWCNTTWLEAQRSGSDTKGSLF